MTVLNTCATCKFQDVNRGFCHCPDRCSDGDNVCFSEVSQYTEEFGLTESEVCEFFEK